MIKQASYALVNNYEILHNEGILYGIKNTTHLSGIFYSIDYEFIASWASSKWNSGGLTLKNFVRYNR